jgi:hypothetical protein
MEKNKPGWEFAFMPTGLKCPETASGKARSREPFLKDDSCCSIHRYRTLSA